MANCVEVQRLPLSKVVNNQEISKNRVDLVRQEYKRYKRKKPPPDLTEVIDFEDPSTFRGRVAKYHLKDIELSKFGLSCVTQWRSYELTCCPGFIFIVNPFLPGAQHFWTRRCIVDYPCKPNVCNLDAHVTVDCSQSLWEQSQRYGKCPGLIDRLRWVHLGYHFNYDAIDYKPDKRYEFPSDLAELMQHIAKAVGYPDYSPEAGIVNFYPLGSSMGGHTDHYESDLSWPLISLSFGQSAIFLIGGATRLVKPTALYIRSGDVVVMSGEARTAFHAVPRIVKVGKENEAPVCLQWRHMLSRTFGSNDDHHSKRKLRVDFAPVEKNVNRTSSRTAQDRSDIPNIARTDRMSTNINPTKENSEASQNAEESFCNKAFGTVQKNGIVTAETFLDRCEVCDCCKETFLLDPLEILTSEDWRQFELYLSKTRINVNVRQVHERGKTFNPLSK